MTRLLGFFSMSSKIKVKFIALERLRDSDPETSDRRSADNVITLLL